MTDNLGIIDPKLNPFVLKKNRDKETKWIKDRFGLTDRKKNSRKQNLQALFGKNEATIRSNFSVNDGRYVAFTGIRWGFAKMDDNGVLTKLEKFDNYYLHDEWGNLIDKSETISNSDYNGKKHRKQKAPSRKPALISSPVQRDELILKLRMFQLEPVIERYLAKDHLVGKTTEEILVFSFDHTIFRAFPDETPTSRYRKWRWYRNPNELCKQLDTLQSQEDFDRFLIELAESLVIDWGNFKDHGGSSYMNIGISLKINNLILKHLVFSKHANNSNLKEWLHVLWDSFTLNPLREIYQGYPPIPKKPSQGFVRNLSIYQELHIFISCIAKEAGVDRINYEFLIWDAMHQAPD